MEVRAVARYQRVSPRKVRLVMDLITGKAVDDAIALLEHLPKGSARLIGRVVRAAVANAENNFNLTMEDLYVKRALADEGPRLKRVWMRGRGRRDIKVHRTCHVTVVVEDQPERAARSRRAPAPAATRPEPRRPRPAAARRPSPRTPAQRTRRRTERTERTERSE
jgi:large subunit ribosomal protein L22